MLNNLNTVSGKPGKARTESSKFDALDQRLQDVENKIDELQNDVYTERTHTDDLEVTQTADINAVEANQVNTRDLSANSAVIDKLNTKEASIEKITGDTEIENANIKKATIPNINGNVAVDGTLTTESIKTKTFAIDKLATEELTVEKKAEIKELDTTNITAENIDTTHFTTEDITTKQVDAEDIGTKTFTTEEATIGKAEVTSIDVERLSAQILESAESTCKTLVNDSIKFTGELDLEQELQTEEDWYTITIPPFENAIIQLNADYKSLDNASTKHWGVSIVATKEQAIIEWSEGDFNGIKDFSFNEETKETRLRVRAIDKINYHIIHNDLELDGTDILDIKYGEFEDAFEVFYAPEAWRGYYLQTYRMNNDIDSYSVFRYNGVANLPGLRVEQKMFDDIYIKYNIWLPDYFENDETPHFVKGEENQYLSVTAMDVCDKDGNLESNKPVTSWHTPVDNDTYPTPLSNSSCLISERSIVNYNGTADIIKEVIDYIKAYSGVIKDFDSAYDYVTDDYGEKVETHDTDGNLTGYVVTFHSGVFFININDNYYEVDEIVYDKDQDIYQVGYNTESGVQVDILQPEDSIDFYTQTTKEETETAYPISELRDETTVHGDFEVENDAVIDNNLEVKGESTFNDTATFKEQVEIEKDLHIQSTETVDGTINLTDTGAIVSKEDDKKVIDISKDTVYAKNGQFDNLKADTIRTGDLFVDGTIHAVNEETIEATSDTITLRQNNPKGLGDNEVSGLIVNNYDGTGKLLEIATDNTGTLRVGTGTGSTTSYSVLYIDKSGDYYNEDKDKIDRPKGVLTSYTNKEEIEDEDLGLVTKYTTAKFTEITLDTMQPVTTRAEEADMAEDGIVCWNKEKSRVEATNTLDNPTTFTTCITTPWMCGTSSGVCAYENTEEEDVECLIPIPGWNTDELILERTNCLRMNPTNGDIHANHIYGIFDGSVDTAACVDIYDWQNAIAAGGLPNYVLDSNGCKVEVYDTNGDFTGYAVTLAKPERLFVPAVVVCTCGHSQELYGSDWVSYNLCNSTVEYKNPVEFGDWSVSNSNRTNVHSSCIDFKLQNYECGDYTATLRQTYGGRVDLTVNNGYGSTVANASNTFCFCSNGSLYVPQCTTTRFLNLTGCALTTGDTSLTVYGCNSLSGPIIASILRGSMRIGSGARIDGAGSLAIGLNYECTSSCIYCTYAGPYSVAIGSGSCAIGGTNRWGTVAIGYVTYAYGGIAIGSSAKACGEYSISIGTGYVHCTAASGIIIGSGCILPGCSSTNNVCSVLVGRGLNACGKSIILGRCICTSESPYSADCNTLDYAIAIGSCITSSNNERNATNLVKNIMIGNRLTNRNTGSTGNVIIGNGLTQACTYTRGMVWISGVANCTSRGGSGVYLNGTPVGDTEIKIGYRGITGICFYENNQCCIAARLDDIFGFNDTNGSLWYVQTGNYSALGSVFGNPMRTFRVCDGYYQFVTDAGTYTVYRNCNATLNVSCSQIQFMVYGIGGNTY